MQPNSNISFRANKVLTATKVSKNGTQSVVDVFKLKRYNKNDREFATICNMALNTRKLNKQQKNLKEILVDFLDYGRYQDFYIAIKDGEQITNGLEASVSSISNATILEKVTSLTKNDMASEAIMLAFFNDIKKHVSKKVLAIPLFFNFKLNFETPFEKIANIKQAIQRKNPEITYKKIKDNQECNLKEFLGIGEIL